MTEGTEKNINLTVKYGWHQAWVPRSLRPPYTACVTGNLGSPRPQSGLVRASPSSFWHKVRAKWCPQMASQLHHLGGEEGSYGQPSDMEGGESEFRGL